MPLIDLSWIGWIKFWSLAAVLLWVALMAGFFFVLPENKKVIVRERWGDPADCPGIIWSWFSEAATAVWKTVKGATLASSEVVPDHAQNATNYEDAVLAMAKDKYFTFEKLRELTDAQRHDKVETADYYLIQAETMLSNMRLVALPMEQDAERIARLIIVLDKLAGARGYDLEFHLRKVLGS